MAFPQLKPSLKTIDFFRVMEMRNPDLKEANISEFMMLQSFSCWNPSKMMSPAKGVGIES